MKLYFATDHAGFDLKNMLFAYVREELGLEVEDCGAYELDPQDDYPDFIRAATEKMASAYDNRAVILGGSGTGEAICANRVRGIRAVVYNGGNLDIVRLSREHNDANVLSLGARFLDGDVAKEALSLWLKTPFSGDERHIRRLQKLDR